MSTDNRLESRINTILAKWNPLDVPDFIAEDEYKAYIKDIILIGKKQDKLAIYLNKLLEEYLGLDIDEGSIVQHEEMQGVVDKLLQVL